MAGRPRSSVADRAGCGDIKPLQSAAFTNHRLCGGTGAVDDASASRQPKPRAEARSADPLGRRSGCLGRGLWPLLHSAQTRAPPASVEMLVAEPKQGRARACWIQPEGEVLNPLSMTPETAEIAWFRQRFSAATGCPLWRSTRSPSLRPRAPFAHSRYRNGTAQSSGHGYSSCCDRSSRISYHGAFEPTNIWAVGLRVGASISDPYGTRILPS